LLLTTDSQVEGVHFPEGSLEPAEAVRRAVAVAVSDIGAMGGVPRWVLTTFGIPPDMAGAEGLVDGLGAAAAEFAVEPVGGNITSSPRLFIDVAAVGEVDEGSVVTRKGARPGDAVFVTGTVGDARAGLEALERGIQGAHACTLIERFLRPRPPLALGAELGRQRLASAMIDVSDGLALDLERITVRYGLGARVHAGSLPLSEAFAAVAPSLWGEDAVEAAISGGEDYELLFTVPPGCEAELERTARALGVAVTRIGEVREAGGVVFEDDGGRRLQPRRKGYVHG